MVSKFIFDEYWISIKIDEVLEQKKSLQRIEEQISILKNSSINLDMQMATKISSDICELIYSFEKTSDSLNQFIEKISLMTMKNELELEEKYNYAIKLFL